MASAIGPVLDVIKAILTGGGLTGAVVVPLRSDLPFFDLQAVLDGTTYTLQFRWNVRCSAWFMDVLDETADNVLVGGLQLVVDFPLGVYQTGRNPPGVFMLIDASGLGLDPGINDLGQRVRLLYFTAAALGLV